MLSYCYKSRKNIESKNLEVSKTENWKIMLFYNCVLCNSKKSKFIKVQEASGLLSQLDIRTPFSKIPLLDDMLF